MRPHLLYPDRDFAVADRHWSTEDLVFDLGLSSLFAAMAGGDPATRAVARDVVLAGETDVHIILHRQDVLRDCLNQEKIVKDVRRIASEMLAGERKHVRGWIDRRSPNAMLRRTVEVLDLFFTGFAKLREIGVKHGHKFSSRGFTELFDLLNRDLDRDYLSAVKDHLKRLRFADGALVSAKLDEGNKGTGYTLRRAPEKKLHFVGSAKPSGYTFEIDPRDERAAMALAQLQARGIASTATMLAQAADHILGFFSALQLELTFYTGCANLHAKLVEKNVPVCFPRALSRDEVALSADQLYDVGLELNLPESTTPNQLRADGKLLVMVTGANQGGKSTFLRSVGLAQVMMQSGMFVGAKDFRANVCDRIFTHYKRDEDSSMSSGKLDEELRRMNSIANSVTPDSLVLFNESFAATNELEGSEIARQIVRALRDSDVKVIYVTHFYDLAKSMYDGRGDRDLFLRAQREPDGTRRFEVVPGEPLATSFGNDLYDRIFGVAPR